MKPKHVYIIHSATPSNPDYWNNSSFPHYHACSNLTEVYKFLQTLSDNGPRDLKSYEKFYKDFHAQELYKYHHHGTYVIIAKLTVNKRMPWPFCF